MSIELFLQSRIAYVELIGNIIAVISVSMKFHNLSLRRITTQNDINSVTIIILHTCHSERVDP